MIETIIIFSLTVLLVFLSILFFPNIKINNRKFGTYWIITLISAFLLLLFGCVDFSDVAKTFVSNTNTNPLKILSLFISMTILSIFLDEIGFFKFIAIKAAKKFKKSQITLFIGFYLLISILTIFTSNDIIILTFTPFICYFCKNAKINPIPYLISEFIAANTWSMFFIIGNPTNIYISNALGVDFITYLKNMAIPTIFAGISSFIIISLLFRKQLKEPLNFVQQEEIKLNRFFTAVGLIHLGTATILLIISSYIGLEMYIISICLAISLLIFIFIYQSLKKQPKNYLKSTLSRCPWSLIPFLISMFIIVLSLSKQGISSRIAGILNQNAQIFTYGYSATLTANLMNNIPMSILYSSFLNSASVKAAYATIISSNIAAFITPVGALAGIMFLSLVKNYNTGLTPQKFMKYGFIIGLPVLTISLLGLLIC